MGPGLQFRPPRPGHRKTAALAQVSGGGGGVGGKPGLLIPCKCLALSLREVGGLSI